jgi:hypothetical protein
MLKQIQIELSKMNYLNRLIITYILDSERNTVECISFIMKSVVLLFLGRNL